MAVWQLVAVSAQAMQTQFLVMAALAQAAVAATTTIQQHRVSGVVVQAEDINSGGTVSSYAGS